MLLRPSRRRSRRWPNSSVVPTWSSRRWTQPAVERAWTHNADAIALDLHSLPAAQKGQARARIREQLAGLGRGGAEAFVSISQAHLYADAEAAVWPGLAGLLIAHPASVAEQVQEADEVVTELEKRHGVGAGSVEIVVLLGTAKGVWNIREIITASPRVTTVGLDESHLLMDLGLLPSPEEDPLEFYARGRIVLEAAGVPAQLHGHHGVYRLGLGYPLSSFPNLDATADEVRTAAKDGKELGFNGALCWAPEWVEPCNRRVHADRRARSRTTSRCAKRTRRPSPWAAARWPSRGANSSSAGRRAGQEDPRPA